MTAQPRTHQGDRAALAAISTDQVIRARRALFNQAAFLCLRQQYDNAVTLAVAQKMGEVLPYLVREADEPFYQLRMMAEDLHKAARDGMVTRQHVAQLRGMVERVLAGRIDQGM